MIKDWRGFFVGVFIFCFFLFLSLLAVEAYFRVFDPQGVEESVFNESYHWRHIPGYKGVFKSLYPGEFSTRFEVNSKGIRDYEYNYSRNGRLRIVVLGDSFAVGHGVEMNESFPKLLEAHLGPGFEVINGGHKGFSPEEEFLFYKYEMSKYDPDVVMMALFMGNDFYGGLSLVNVSGADGRIVVEERGFSKPSFQLRLRMFLARNSHAYNFFVRSFVKIPSLNALLVKLGFFSPAWPPYYALPFEEYDANLNQSLLLLKAFNRELAEQDIFFVVVLLPEMSQVYGDVYEENLVRFNISKPVDLDYGNRRVLSFCSDEGILCIDALPSFRQHANESLFFRYDEHFTRRGHALTESLIYDSFYSYFFNRSGIDRVEGKDGQ